MRVAVYHRADGSRGLTAQQIYLQKCLDRHPDWKVVAEYADTGIRAYSENRPGLSRLLADAKEKKFDIALAQSAERFAPDGNMVLRLANQLSNSGVEIKFANGIDYELMPLPKEVRKARPTRAQER